MLRFSKNRRLGGDFNYCNIILFNLLYASFLFNPSCLRIRKKSVLSIESYVSHNQPALLLYEKYGKDPTPFVSSLYMKIKRSYEKAQSLKRTVAKVL